GAGARAERRAKLSPHRAAAGDPHDLAAAGVEFRSADKVLLARRRHFGERDHAPRHGAFGFHLPAARNLHLHRHRLFLHLLAAGDGDSHLGAAPRAALNAMQAPESRAAIVRRIAQSTGDLVALTRALVAAPSPNPPGDVTAAAQVAIAFLETIPGAAVE